MRIATILGLLPWLILFPYGGRAQSFADAGKYLRGSAVNVSPEANVNLPQMKMPPAVRRCGFIAVLRVPQIDPNMVKEVRKAHKNEMPVAPALPPCPIASEGNHSHNGSLNPLKH